MLANTRSISMAILIVCVAAGAVIAGDDASGSISYSVDLSQTFTTYSMSERDQQWSISLARRLHYRGSTVHFVRTSLPLRMDDATIQGSVYQAVERPNYFYIVKGDAMLKIGARWAYNPGVGGFSIYAPRSRGFIVCFNLGGGVPFLSSSPVQRGQVQWKGHDWNRLSKSVTVSEKGSE